MTETRPAIPDPIMREVRQRCGFGCVFCGMPLYQYDHMIDYSIVKEHKADNLTLLCNMHHQEKTNGLLTVNQVMFADRQPFNVINKASSPYLLNFQGADFSAVIGDVMMKLNNVNANRDFLIPFYVNNKKLISFEIIEGKLFFNLLLIDEKGNILMEIIENEMIYSSEIWDIEFIARRLKIRSGSRRILFDIEFNIPNSVKIHKAQFNCDEYQIDVKNGGFTTKGFQIFIKNILGARIVCALGKNDSGISGLING